MINNKGAEAKYNISMVLDGTTGQKNGLNGQSCHVETVLRFEVTGVGVTNTIDVEVRLRNSPNWYVIATIPGAVSGTLDISTYDFIRFNVTTADGAGTMYASGYVLNNPGSGGGGGSATAANQVTGNNSLASIDLKTPGSLLSNIKYDDIQATYPTPTTELYKYYLATVLQATVELTYATSTKNDLVRARRV